MESFDPMTGSIIIEINHIKPLNFRVMTHLGHLRYAFDPPRNGQQNSFDCRMHVVLCRTYIAAVVG